MAQKSDIAPGTTESVRQMRAPQWRSEDFKTIVTMNADAMVVLDLKGRVLYVNPAGESLFNLSAAEMVGAMFGFPIVPDKPVEMYILREFEQFVAVEMRLVEVVWSGQNAYLISLRDLTDRILAEQALRTSRDRLETVVHDQSRELLDLGHSLQESEKFVEKAQSIAHLGFWVWDIAKDTLQLSDEACRILGLRPGETIASYNAFLQFAHPEDRQIVDRATRDALDGKRPYNVEWRLLAVDGTVRYMYSQGEVERENGSPVRMMGTLLDITDRKHIEESLRESEDRYRAFFENNIDAVLITAPDGTIESANAEACRIFGRTEKEIIREGRNGVTDTSDPRLRHVLEERARTGKFKGELSFRRKDGSVFPGEVSTGLFRDRKGNVKTAMTIRDITKRKQAEEDRERLLREVNEQRARLQAILDSLPVGVFIADATGRIVQFNDMARKIWGGDAPMSRRIDEYSLYKGWWADSGKPVSAEEWGLARAITMGETSVGEVIDIQRFDGTRGTMLNSAAPVRDACGNIIGGVVILQDITQRRQMEKELSEAKAQAELYLDLMGHDINNINQSAMGFLELALETLEMDKKIKLDDKILIEKPLKALHNSATLIDNVRKLQRLMKEGVKTRPVDLTELLSDMDVSSFQLNGREIAINIQPLPHCIVRADELLKDVIYNLINNAVKHSDEDKPLTVNVSVVPAEADGRAYYKCIVEDNGPGIPDDIKDKLFTRFQRGATKAHGKGLGLYLVRTLVESYHGKVWIEDRVAGDHTKGAKFVVMLPAA